MSAAISFLSGRVSIDPEICNAYLPYRGARNKLVIVLPHSIESIQTISLK